MPDTRPTCATPPGSRRRFLRQTVTGAALVAGAASGRSHAASTEAHAPGRSLEYVARAAHDALSIESAREPLDALVIGGGPAGLVAAVQAGRAGARTLLVEKSGVLGGTTVLNGVNFPGLFHAWGKQIIAGIGWELVTRTVDLCGETLPDFSQYDQRHWKLQVRVNPAVFAALADDAVLGAGAGVLFHAVPVDAQRDGGFWRVTLATKEGPRAVSARTLIDCTGDANLAGMAGFERVRSAGLQPGTIILRLGGYDLDALDTAALQAAYDRAVAEGALERLDIAGGHVRGFLAGRGDNNVHIVGIDGASSEGKTRAELLARRQMLRLYRFFKAQPGLERFTIEGFATECGIRETFTIKGRATVRLEDYVSGRLWDDAVCFSFYPIDVHRPSGEGIDIRPLAEGTTPTIPRGAMLPEGGAGFVVAGRCISGDQEANSAYRVQASCMAMGQAAGAMAALAARRNEDVAETPIDALRELLAAHGAIVPGIHDV